MPNFKIVDDVIVESGVNPFFQAGDICIYTSISVPQGWLDCNGQTYDPIIYPDLANAIGTYYGQGTVYRLPNMNSNGLSYPSYVSATPSSEPNYVSTSLSTHSHSLTSTQDLNTDSFSSSHTHNYAYNSNSANDDHSHALQFIASGGLAWAISADIANYSTTGTAGGTAFRNHQHNAGNSNLSGPSVSINHSHTHSGSSSLTAESHSHTYRTTYASNSVSDVYPETISVKFMVKI